VNMPPASAGTIVAFQIWDAVGWLGQGLFTLRVVVQWWASERAGRSVLPRSFWWISLAGSLALLVYVSHRQDPVFLAGVSINTAIYARNLFLIHRTPDTAARPRSPWLPVLLGLGVAAAAAVVLWKVGAHLVEFDEPAWLLALGFAAQAIWSSRFILQWYASERAGRSVLPPSFFLVSTAGALLLLAYAIVRVDWVMMAAFALNPIPYVRNLILMKRAKVSTEPLRETS